MTSVIASPWANAKRVQAIVTSALLLAFVCMLFGFVNTARATSAPAGTVIGNQASATYSDASQVARTVTSNTVLTTVQQIASLTIVATGAKTITPGGQVYYPHTLTNTGNGTDSFSLAGVQAGTMTFGTMVILPDADGNGIPDSQTPITSTGSLPAGGVFKFVVAGSVPTTALAGNVNTTTITAASVFTPAVTGTVVDTTTVTNQGVINATEALDVTAGPSPSTTNRTITLAYSNTGNATVTGLTLADAIPSGMTYVAGSARWSVTGSGTVLTDASNTDSQSGIIYDFGVTTANKATAVIASVTPGSSGTVTFQVSVNSGLPPGANTATALTATFAYNDGANAVAASNTNTVQYTVLQSAGVTLTGGTVAAAPQGGTVSFTDTVTNTGNGTDTFDMTFGTSTFPAGTSFQFFQADGVTPLNDSNGNGIPDTGPMAPGAALNIVVKAVLPPGSTGGPYTKQLTATSKVNTAITATATDTLTAISGNIVDMTNDTAVPGASGVGAGPEASPLLTLPVNPGATLRVPLIISNGSSVADAFDLSAATDSAFANGIPTGWSVVFRDYTTNAVVTTTGVINSTASKEVYADITAPAGTPAGTTQMYFRALSAATGASDRLHDAVSINTVRSLVMTPNHTGQTTASGTVYYIHTLTNTGNVTEGDGSASVGLATLADSITGFTSVVYWDKNNNGQLDAGDPVFTDLASLVGGTNGANTTPGLAPGKSVTLIVKVTAPASASPGLADTATLTVTLSGTIGTVTAPAPAFVTDGTSVVVSQITLITTQALDANCDGIADTVFSTTPITAGALPGGCIRYQVTATNAGSNTVTGLVISNATPALTTYHATVPAATTIGTVTNPAANASGTVQATVGTLAAGQSAVMSFGVKIAP